MTRAASAVPFRLLLLAIAAVALLLDMTLAHARTTRRLPAAPAADCSAPARPPATTASAPASPAAPRLADPTVPPGFVAAFGACGDSAATSTKDR